MPARSKPSRAVLAVARLLTAVVSLAGAEAVLFIGGYPPWRGRMIAVADEYAPDPELGWILKPGQFDLAGVDSSFRYTNWSRGRRATSIQEGDSNAAARAVQIYGDSYVQGFGLSDMDTFPWIMQERHPGLAVTNYGTSGYGTYQSYLSMKRSARQGADVFYLFNGFHEERNVGDPSWLRLTHAPPADYFMPYAELHSGVLREQRSRGQMIWALSHRLRTVAMAQEYFHMFGAYQRVRSKRQVTEAILLKMNETVANAGGRLTIILFDLDPEPRQDYRRFLDTNRIRYLDCDRPEMKDSKLRLPDGHPNRKLNELLVDWMDRARVIEVEKETWTRTKA